MRGLVGARERACEQVVVIGGRGLVGGRVIERGRNEDLLARLNGSLDLRGDGDGSLQPPVEEGSKSVSEKKEDERMTAPP